MSDFETLKKRHGKTGIANVQEKSIERYFVRKVKEAGFVAAKFAIPGTRGAPDRIILGLGGRVIFVELKRPVGGVVSPNQRKQMETLRSIGFDVFVVNTRGAVDDFVRRVLNA